MPYDIVYKNELKHHGILGQKWGVRRYQNEDGSYTPEGKERRRVDYDGDESRQNGGKSKLSKGEKAVLVAAGAALAIGTAGYLYSKNKTKIDAAVANSIATLTEHKTKIGEKIEAGRKAVADSAKKASDKDNVEKALDKAAKEAERTANKATKKAEKFAEEVEKKAKKARNKDAWEKFKGEVKAEKENRDPLPLRAAKEAKLLRDKFKAGIHDGFENGIKEGTTKSIKVVMTGAAIVATKKMLDSAIGEDKSATIFTAANPKKVSSFWNATKSEALPNALESAGVTKGKQKDD